MLGQRMVAFKILLFTLFLPVVFIVLVPYFLVSFFGGWLAVDIGIIRYIGLIPILFGIFAYIRCAWSFGSGGKGTPAPIDPPKKLVIRGLYTYVRNPMYVGVLALLIGESILFSSLIIFFYTAVVFVCFHLFVVVYEEPTLRDKFGDSYRRYCDSVPRWLPRWEKAGKKKKEGEA